MKVERCIRGKRGLREITSCFLMGSLALGQEAGESDDISVYVSILSDFAAAIGLAAGTHNCG